MVRAANKDNFGKGENGRYTEEFKQSITDCIAKGMSATETAKEIGIEPFGTGYRQLYTKLAREYQYAKPVKQLVAKTSSNDIKNVKDDGIMCKEAPKTVKKVTKEKTKPTNNKEEVMQKPPEEVKKKLKLTDDIKAYIAELETKAANLSVMITAKNAEIKALNSQYLEYFELLSTLMEMYDLDEEDE